MLKVVSFDVEDENQDGINEPGEHIIVKNLIVENVGMYESIHIGFVLLIKCL